MSADIFRCHSWEWEGLCTQWVEARAAYYTSYNHRTGSMRHTVGRSEQAANALRRSQAAAPVLYGVSGVSLLPRSPAVLGVENHGKRPQMKPLFPSKGAWLVSLPWPQSLFTCTLSPPCPQTFHFTEEPFMGHLPVERSGFWPECFPWTEDPNKKKQKH